MDVRQVISAIETGRPYSVTESEVSSVGISVKGLAGVSAFAFVIGITASFVDIPGLSEKNDVPTGESVGLELQGIELTDDDEWVGQQNDINELALADIVDQFYVPVGDSDEATFSQLQTEIETRSDSWGETMDLEIFTYDDTNTWFRLLPAPAIKLDEFGSGTYESLMLSRDGPESISLDDRLEDLDPVNEVTATKDAGVYYRNDVYRTINQLANDEGQSLAQFDTDIGFGDAGKEDLVREIIEQAYFGVVDRSVLVVTVNEPTLIIGSFNQEFYTNFCEYPTTTELTRVDMLESKRNAHPGKLFGVTALALLTSLRLRRRSRVVNGVTAPSRKLVKKVQSGDASPVDAVQVISYAAALGSASERQAAENASRSQTASRVLLSLGVAATLVSGIPAYLQIYHGANSQQQRVPAALEGTPPMVVLSPTCDDTDLVSTKSLETITDDTRYAMTAQSLAEVLVDSASGIRSIPGLDG